MTRFRDLLRFDPASSPAEEQARASRNLPEAVNRSNLRSEAGRTTPHEGEYLLVAVASYSHADLAFLDLIDDQFAVSRAKTIPVYVHDLLEYANAEELQADFPGVLSANPTPLAALWESGSALRVESGKRAQDMVAAKRSHGVYSASPMPPRRTIHTLSLRVPWPPLRPPQPLHHP